MLMLPVWWLVVSLLAVAPCVVQAQISFYRPKSLIIPLHDQKNQLHLSVGKGGGYDVNASYAFTEKLAIFTTATFDNFTNRKPALFWSDNYYVQRNDYVVRGGLGYFTSIDMKHLPVLEIYAGAGTSKINNYVYFENPDNRDVTQARYQTVYLQANVGINQAKWIDFAIGTRIAYSHYSDFSFYGPHPYSPGIISGNYNNLWGVTAEPVFSLGFKYKGIKLDGQLGGAIFLFGPKVDNKYDAWGDEDTIVLDALLGRISLQHNLNFSKKND